MFIFLTILILLAAILLILIVVVQNSKGGGLAAGFSAGNQLAGVRKTTDFLEKATWYLAGAIVVLSIISAHFLHGTVETVETQVNKQVNTIEAPKPEALPDLGTTPATPTETPATPATPEKPEQPAQ